MQSEELARYIQSHYPAGTEFVVIGAVPSEEPQTPFGAFRAELGKLPEKVPCCGCGRPDIPISDAIYSREEWYCPTCSPGEEDFENASASPEALAAQLHKIGMSCEDASGRLSACAARVSEWNPQSPALAAVQSISAYGERVQEEAFHGGATKAPCQTLDEIERELQMAKPWPEVGEECQHLAFGRVFVRGLYGSWAWVAKSQDPGLDGFVTNRSLLRPVLPEPPVKIGDVLRIERKEDDGRFEAYGKVSDVQGQKVWLRSYEWYGGDPTVRAFDLSDPTKIMTKFQEVK